ncbi:MAG TPA: MBL fold metallo-hydrolase [Anaerolineae bacterium]|nr:MBL fold metallo-hydrolase [Anaerolineae bacterium]
MRDVAYWPKTFLDEVEKSKPQSGVLFRALGGPSFVYQTPETTIWIDPYFYGTPDDAVPDAYRAVAIPINPNEVTFGDIIISTHDHEDHCSRDTLPPMVRNTAAMCVAPESSTRKMIGFGIPADRIRTVKPGDRFQFRDVEFNIYPSYDANEIYAVTYVLNSGGVKLFISGDTSNGPGLKQVADEHHLDYALLAFGRTWYMNEAQMLEVARILHPKTLLPFHWEFWRNHTGNIQKLFELYYRDRPNFDIKILLIGDSLPLSQ